MELTQGEGTQEAESVSDQPSEPPRAPCPLAPARSWLASLL